MSARITNLKDMPTARSRRAGTAVSVLTYHSISDGPGPTSIPPVIFRGQLETLAECGYGVATLSELADWVDDNSEMPAKSVVITFDDGYADLAEHAVPLLRARDWRATVFLPSGRVGGHEDWEGAHTHPPRVLLSWEQITQLALQGIEFGGHGVTHADLTKLGPQDLEHEVRQSRDEIGRRLGRLPVAFALPYGASSPRVRQETQKWYRVSVGTRLDRAGRNSDLQDVPRIEMHYFRSLRRWRDYLEGRAEAYFEARRTLRAAKQLAARILRRTLPG